MARKPNGGPAADPELLILASLASGAKHGYAIMQDIEAFSRNKLGPGTLYTAITRLVEKGWIQPERLRAGSGPIELRGPECCTCRASWRRCEP
jgi:DNA-binding PadR family transcriptional regulator